MDLEVAFIRLGEATRREMLCAYGFVHHSASSEAGVSGSGGQRRQELRMGESTMMRPRERFSGGWGRCAARRLRGKIVAIAGREQLAGEFPVAFAREERELQ